MCNNSPPTRIPGGLHVQYNYQEDILPWLVENGAAQVDSRSFFEFWIIQLFYDVGFDLKWPTGEELFMKDRERTEKVHLISEPPKVFGWADDS